MRNEAGVPPDKQLALPPVERIAEDLEQHEVGDQPPDEDARLDAEAEAYVERLLGEGQSSSTEHRRRAVDEMGLEAQRRAAHQSAMLQTPLRKLAQQSDDGGPVAKALVDLRSRMDNLDPNRHDLAQRGMDKVVSWLPGVGNRLQRYFRKFENAQDALDAIIADLEDGRDMLDRDNLTLADDQEALHEIIQELHHQIALGQRIDERLTQAAELREASDAQRTFIEEELLFPLRQRVVDLQQQLAVSQQGVLALEVVIRNNRELMRGVDRAINVTVAALSVAVTVAMALANQRLVLERVESINRTTSDMIAGTAKALRNQGVDIQTRAASSMLDMQSLESAFSDVMAALDDLASYRRDALPKLKAQIDRLDTLAGQGEEAIDKFRQGNRADPGDDV
ncbi:toxic anion resistance protein [Aidingimonas lacisalsi]|uniref:toxic anion resistance protein n=1 Tax=Aidingimonas lacisalsi TaxID=2604086 RepID=UPI0011D1E33F|nr:toxic anion resistance protein [Aidingimonas lacisalsi]